MAALRARGKAGLDALLETHAELILRHTTNSTSAPHVSDADWLRLRAALDQVSGQRDCHASQLFWFTDFEQAKAEAQRSGKPILSLRLLGRLDEEFSCANSRFFRTTLYANEEVSHYLRDHFVLHWKSVRPVPRVTIDFGDGRKLERTLTGNSIHYVLSADGRPIDALPGLYGPKAFLTGLARAVEAGRKLIQLTGSAREEFLGQYHRDRLAAIDKEWSDDVRAVGGSAIAMAPATSVVSAATNPPNAAAAGRIAMGKGKAEFPLLRGTMTAPVLARAQLTGATDDALWGRIAALHTDAAKLDRSTVAFMRAKNPSAFEAGKLTESKIRVEDPLLRVVRSLERSIAEDTVRNEYELHARLHEWFATGSAPQDLDRLNARVYAELFLTPDSDPWLGLAPPNAYSALENEGRW
ncbi:MAG TPA: hypothetical protein VGK40_06485 [Verrucomicrobiae bacterium]